MLTGETFMIKVMFFTKGKGIGSGEFHSLLKLCEDLKMRHNCIPLVVLCKYKEGKKYLDEKGIDNIYMRSYSWVVSAGKERKLWTQIGVMAKKILNILPIIRIRKIIRDNEIDVIHLNTTGYYVGAIAAKKAGIPYVWHLRDVLNDDYNYKLCNPHCYSVINDANRIIAISEYVYETYKSVLRPEIDIIYNGVSTNDYYSSDRELFRFDTTRFVCVANMTGNKGQKYVIEAAKKLVECGVTSFYIDFVGEGCYENQYKLMVNKYGLDPNIKFWGKQEDVTRFYKQADVSIMASQAEAFGRVTIEAMMEGCLVIGAEAGATKELLDNDETGIFFKCNDSSDLANVMADIIKGNKEKYRNIARKGQKVALERFASTTCADRIFKLYEEVLNGGG